MDLEDLNFGFNKLIMHPEFNQTVKVIRDLNLGFIETTDSKVMFSNDEYYLTGDLVEAVGEIKTIKMNPSNGYNFQKKINTLGYDESIKKFNSLEGLSFFLSHCLVLMGEDEYIPINFISFYFYTSAREISEKSELIRYSNKPEYTSNRDFIVDKISFLKKAAPSNSLLLVDGPLIGGDFFVYMIKAIESFIENKIIPIFFVKNSGSNLLVNNISEFKGKFNSDLHWAYNFLKPGERTSFFKYQDQRNSKNCKVFCYIKGFDNTPQRVETHIDIYKNHGNIINDILDLIYYQIISQGDSLNPQVRLISVAEYYARSILKLIDTNNIFKQVGLIPTFNQKRFGSLL